MLNQYNHLAFGIWHLAFGIWHLAFGNNCTIISVEHKFIDSGFRVYKCILNTESFCCRKWCCV